MMKISALKTASDLAALRFQLTEIIQELSRSDRECPRVGIMVSSDSAIDCPDLRTEDKWFLDSLKVFLTCEVGIVEGRLKALEVEIE